MEHLLEEQKEQLNEVRQELLETEHENTLLRRDMEHNGRERPDYVRQLRYPLLLQVVVFTGQYLLYC